MGKRISVGVDGFGQHRIDIVNPDDRIWTRHRYILWFGACGTTHRMIWANNFEAALETAGEWLAEHAPGHIMAHGSEEHAELIREACKERGIDFDPSKCYGTIEPPWDEILQEAEADLTYTESGLITSYEWGIDFEDPTREEIKAFIEGR